MADMLSLIKRVRAEKAAAAGSHPPLIPLTGSHPPPHIGESATSSPADATDTHPAPHPPAQLCATLAADLAAGRLRGVPVVWYVPCALSPPDAAALVSAVYAAPTSAWVSLRARRLQSWGGRVTPEGLRDAEPLPSFLQAVVSGLVASGAFHFSAPPNHALVNEYRVGQGILPHTDGPAYAPRTATLSLVSAAIMRLAPRPGAATPGPGFADGGAGGAVQEILLTPGSLVVFSGAAYTDCVHSISDAEEETVGASGPCVNAGVASEAAPGLAASVGATFRRSTRLSITLRHVPLPGAPRPWERGGGSEDEWETLWPAVAGGWSGHVA